jgi:hypothetical protein
MWRQRNTEARTKRSCGRSGIWGFVAETDEPWLSEFGAIARNWTIPKMTNSSFSSVVPNLTARRFT